jgi:arylsulfatase
MFIKGGKLYYDYNFLDGVHYIMESKKLKTGKNELKVYFEHLGKFAGRGKLFVNGELVDEVDMPQTHISTFSLSEPFDVGMDNGTPVSTLYDDAFPFTGKLDKVIFKLE